MPSVGERAGGGSRNFKRGNKDGGGEDTDLPTHSPHTPRICSVVSPLLRAAKGAAGKIEVTGCRDVGNDVADLVLYHERARRRVERALVLVQ